MQGKVIAGLDIVDEDFNVLGKTGGSKTVQLTKDQLPKINGSFTMHGASSSTPVSNVYGDFTSDYTNSKYKNGGTEVSGAGSKGNVRLVIGNDEAHENKQPYNTLNYIIKAYSGTDVPVPVELSSVKNVYDNSTSNVYSTSQANIRFGDITVLYDNPNNITISGTNISLSDSAANYEKIKVFYTCSREGHYICGSTEAYACNERYITLSSGIQSASNSRGIEESQATYYVDGTSFNFTSSNNWEGFNGGGFAINDGKAFFITRIEGIHKK